MLHLTDIKKYERCPRAFWLSRRKKKEFVPFVNYNESMSELVKQLLMIRDEDVFVGQANDSGDLALAALSTKRVLIHARFVYKDLRINIPFLIQENGKRILYFTYRSCYPKEQEAVKIAQNLAVLDKLGVSVDEVYAIHLRADYVRGSELDVHQLLQIDAYLYNSKNKAHKTIQELLKQQTVDLDAILEKLHTCEQMEEVPIKRSHICTRGGKCMYYADCFPEELPDDSILNLVQAAHKYAMHQEGITSLQEADINRIEGTRHQYAQIMAARNNGLYVDKGALRCWKKAHIQEPVSYLDFEWETYAFPPYKGMKPFDVLVFQYSLHVEEHGQLRHAGYIGEGDCRKEFIEHLLREIPKSGSILVYNMEGAEKLRLVQLAQQFPQYEEQLRAVWERMVDLSLPFSTGNVYDTRMAGYYSLKKLVPIFSDYHYEDLDISYGMDAVEKWREYCSADGEKKQELYRQLEQYCSMDTYAEYIVYHALEDMIRE